MVTKLKVLNLGNCLSLRRTPDLSVFESLEILILADCENLKTIHPSIGDIKTLISLDVSNCKRLQKLPVGVGRMVKLRDLRINGTHIQKISISRGCLMKLETLCARSCERLSQLPKSMGSLVSLTLLDLSCSEIEELPESIGSMKDLKTLNASKCRRLARIPSSIGNLASLQSLFLYYCSSLTEIPDSIGKLASLTELDLGYTSITKLPESIGNMPNLRILKIIGTHVTELPNAIGKLAKLQRLGARLCKKLERLPSNICELVSLEELSLDFSGISNLPESISKLSSLQELGVEYCEKLREIPELPSGLTDLRIICQSPPLPHLSQLTRLTKLTLCNCPWLERVPELPIGLSQLNIINCGKLKAFTNLSNLKHLSMILYNCFDLAKVTGLEGSHCLSNLPAGQCPKISRVDGIEDSSTLMSPNASQLNVSLDLSDSKILQRMDAGASCANSVEIQDPGGSKSSQVSDILKCTSARRLLDFSSFKYLSSLTVLSCNSVTEIQGLDGSESLTFLCFGCCSSLRSVDLSNERLELMMFLRKSNGCSFAVTAMLQQATQYVDQTPDVETKIELIRHLTLSPLGRYKLLEQRQGRTKLPLFLNKYGFFVRLCIDLQDYVCSHILSRKIGPRVFDTDPSKEKKKPKEGENIVEQAPADIPSLLELKWIYYDSWVRYRYDSHNNDYLEICRYYKAIYEIPSVKGNPKQWIPVAAETIGHNGEYIVVPKYYSRITLKILAELLCLIIQGDHIWSSD
ncbi:disease resistance protein RUN1-like [Syzygium oleosum]|uniref:disease resistance protein RUN1-like n=1 Tax=Syzygium oleosum TaxID=219896 RepID=UPI0024BA0D8F|nr:disease resistance protein RUN1-like [Syzygium oleosum]